jgi:hypothetical protein
MRPRSLVAASLLALAALPAQAVSAQPDHVGTLRSICEAQGGDFYVTPYNRARCQGTRPSDGADDGLRAAATICTMQLGGDFRAAPSYGTTDGTMTWICI